MRSITLRFLVSILLLSQVLSCSFFSEEGHKFVMHSSLFQERIETSNLVTQRYLRDRSLDDQLLVPQIPEPLMALDIPREKAYSKKLITIDITEDIPVRDAIIEIAKLANVDIQIDPKIDEYVILSLKDKPIDDVFERVADLANLRYTVKGEVIKFERDLPYVVNYNVSFLDVKRKGTANYGVTDFAMSNAANGNNNGNGNNNNNFNNNGNNNFNNGLGNNGNNGSNNFNYTNNNNGGMAGASGTSQVNNTSEWSPWDSVESSLKSIVKGDNSYTINKQAGIITVSANYKTHKQTESYIENVKKRANAQVLIEVKLVEVNLSDEFRSGIDFKTIEKNDRTNTIFNGISAPFAAGLTTAASGSQLYPLVLSGQKANLEGAVTLLSTFGTTKTLSSPRINVVNNQQAVLSFAQNYVYFSLNPTIQNQLVTTSGPANANVPIIVNTSVQTVPVGVILSLQASVEPDTDEVTMMVRPSVSKVVDTKDDPSATFLSRAIVSKDSTGKVTGDTTPISNKVPVIEKKELDSVMKIKSGDVMVIGGFTEEKKGSTESGVPFFKDIPLLGYLFKNKVDTTSSVETVIFIKATIINSSGSVMKKDLDMYNDFVNK